MSMLLAVPFFCANAATQGYAWSNNIGWINFGCTNCNVQVTDSALTGYAWNDNYGWIKLNPSTSGVINTNGALSGYAWGENTGWINFSGVSIGCTGKFTGSASGDVVGTVQFSSNQGCTYCGITTDWRPSNCGGGTTYYNLTATGNHGIVSPGSGSYGAGTVLTLTATADPGYVFSSWSQDITGSTNPYLGMLMDFNKNVTANFTFTSCPTDFPYKNATNDCVKCLLNSDCGADSWTGQTFCQTGDTANVYQNYTAYVCSSAGAKNSQCESPSVSARVKEACTGGKTCFSGACVAPIACSVNSDCPGTSGWTGSTFCKTGDTANVYQNYTAVTCSKPGTLESSCSSPTEERVKTTCLSGEVCENGGCVAKQHTECVEKKCVIMTGAGTDQCATDNDCKNEKHNMCSQQQCVSVGGAGPDECQQNSDCQLQYNACQNLKCVSVNGIGLNQCSTDNDCTAPKHNECQNQQCIVVDGAGSNQCLSSAECIQGVGLVTHNECNDRQQCVAMEGAGSNQCFDDDGCVIVSVVENIVNAVEQQLPEPAKVVVQQTRKIVESPQGSIATKAASVAGIVVVTAATASALPSFALFEIFLIPFRLFSLLLTGLGLKRRFVPWGIVYDSVTKRPLDPAYVVLKNIQTGKVSSAVTDLDGRYGFLVEPGTYQIVANKTNYIFPSQKLSGKIQDELYSSLYFGENIVISKSGEIISKNIPLDPLKFDWNEFEKKSKKLIKFYSKWNIASKRVYDWFFAIGFLVAIVAFAFAPYPYNTIIIGLYILMLILRIFGLKPKSFGYVVEKSTGLPLSFAIIRVMMPGTENVIASKPADAYGRYYCLVSPGEYYVKIDKKNPDGSYSNVYTSEIIDASKKGIIKEGFRI